MDILQLSSDCLARVATTLDEPEVMVSGAVSRQHISGDIARTQLGYFHRIRQLYMEASWHVPVPMGRMMAFQRELLDELPETALAEDRFVTLLAIKHFGHQAVRCASETFVYAQATQTMEDYVALGVRYNVLRQDLLQQHPELKQPYDEAVRLAAEQRPSQQEIQAQLFSAMQQEGIPLLAYYQWQCIRDTIAAKSSNMRHKVFETDGTWRQLTSTKHL